MKRIGYYIIALLILATSCKDDFLDTESPSQQSTENTFKTTFFTEAAMKGLYSMLTESTVYGQKLSTNWPTCSDIETCGFSTGNLIGNSDGTNAYYFSSKNNGNCRWDNLYRLVEMSATAVDGIRKSPLMKTSDSTLMKSYLGEALTMRALGYFELVKVWGDVPFRKETVNITTAYEPKTDRDTIYKYIVKDLVEAQSYLPWMSKSVGGVSYTAERVTKGFAKGLIAKVALFAGGWSLRDANIFPYQKESLEHKSDIPELNGYFVGRVKNYKDYYAIAAQQAAEVIGSAENPHTLDPDFVNVWKTVTGLGLNSSNENLLEVANGLGQNGDIGSLIGVNLANNTQFTNSTISLGGSNVKSTAYYFYSFDSLDVRRDATITNISYTNSGYKPASASKGVEGESFGNDALDWKFSKWRFYWMSPSYMNLLKTANSRISTGVNWIVMRYPDLLLMFAEAQNELNGPDAVNPTAKISARQALEKVRTRAFPGRPERVKLYSTDFFDAIVNERAWEFGGEALRKYDLVRWGLLSKKLEEQKKALCLMINGQPRSVSIFDKTYSAGTLPTKLYYKWTLTPTPLGSLYLIDRASVNWYNTPAVTPNPTVYGNTNWLYAAVGNKSIVSKTVTILTEAAGLDASYDYSQFTSQLDSVTAIDNSLKMYTLGNGVCNYRHPYAIYYTELQNSKDALVNSYGY